MELVHNREPELVYARCYQRLDKRLAGVSSMMKLTINVPCTGHHNEIDESMVD